MTARTGSRVRLWGPVVAYMAAIFVVSHQSSPPMPPSISDKALHLLAYGGLAVLAARALAGGIPARLTRRTALVALAITIGYGIIDELHQAFVPGRAADALDVAADAAGGVLALIALKAWDILGTPKSQRPSPKSGY